MFQDKKATIENSYVEFDLSVIKAGDTVKVETERELLIGIVSYLTKELLAINLGFRWAHVAPSEIKTFQVYVEEQMEVSKDV